MNRSALPFVVSLVVASLAAQDPARPAEPKRDRTEVHAREMRDQIENGKQIESHVRVSVRLKNGNRLSGVVKDGRLVERVDGLRFVDASAKDPGAGIRLWYSNGGRNFVFVPFTDLAEYEVLQRLSQKQLDDIESEMQMNELRRQEEQRAAAQRAAEEAKAAEQAQTGTPAPDAGQPSPDAVPAAPGAAGAPVATDPAAKPGTKNAKAVTEGAVDPAKADAAAKKQLQDYLALVQDYPPTAGWNKARRDEIAKRFVVVGAKPSEKEQRFVDKFADWERACSFFGMKTDAEAKSADGGSGDAGSQDSGTGRSKKRKSSGSSPSTTGSAEGETETTETGRSTRKKRT